MGNSLLGAELGHLAPRALVAAVESSASTIRAPLHITSLILRAPHTARLLPRKEPPVTPLPIAQWHWGTTEHCWASVLPQQTFTNNFANPSR